MSKSKKIILGILFWVWQLTWGAIMTYPGLIVALICIMLKGKVHKNGFSFIIEIGGDWGGISLGAVSLCGNYSKGNQEWWNHIRKHESGHGYQALWWGVLFPFVIGLPSLIRSTFHLYEIYDSVWYEGQATRIGTKWTDRIERPHINKQQ